MRSCQVHLTIMLAVLIVYDATLTNEVPCADLTAQYVCTAHAVSVNVSNNIAW